MTKIPEWWMKDKLVNMLSSLIDYRWKTPTPSETWIITLSAKSVKMWFIDYDQAYHISKETYDKFMTRWFPKKWDILMTTEAPLWCIAKLDRDDVSVAQRLLTLRWKEWELDNNYMMYYLMSQAWQHELLSRMSWSTVWWISRKQFDNVEIILPPLSEQKAIAGVLSAFDDKIELLKAENQTLEEMGQTIFKERFGKYKVWDELPNGWKVGKLGEVVEFIIDNRWKTPLTSDKWDYPMVEINSIIWDSMIIDINNCKKFVDQELYDTWFRKWHPKKWDVLFSTVWSIWEIAFVFDEIFCIAQNIVWLRSKYWKYMYLLLKSIQWNLKALDISSVQPSIKLPHLLDYDIVIPDEIIIKDFETKVNPIFEKINNNWKQINALISTRDQLLPKLMSWEVRVKF